jgi:hypothetical protein
LWEERKSAKESKTLVKSSTGSQKKIMNIVLKHGVKWGFDWSS